MDVSGRGHLELLLLALLRRPAHGYALIEEMRSRSGGALDVPEGSVYPALYRLERAGWISSTDESVNGRRRRIYRLTPHGHAALDERTRAWAAETKVIADILDGGAVHAGS
jgi:DNA-binding PadR family transcriptional regulator